jgi:hypothetical protein
VQLTVGMFGTGGITFAARANFGEPYPSYWKGEAFRCCLGWECGFKPSQSPQIPPMSMQVARVQVFSAGHQKVGKSRFRKIRWEVSLLVICGYRCGLPTVGALTANIVLTTSGRARSPCNLHRFPSQKGIQSRSRVLEALPVLILRLIVTAGKLVGMVYAFVVLLDRR